MSVRSLIAIFLIMTSPVMAQDLEAYQQRQRDLSTLAELFGEMHHIRRTCDPRLEADAWRDRMKQLMDLEEPQEAERQKLVQQFNKGYRGAQRRYPRCDRRARDYAAGRAAQGEAVISRLTRALREEQGEVFTTSPLVITPTNPSGIED